MCDDPVPSTRTITSRVAYLLIVGICKVKHQVVLVWSRSGSIKQHGCLLRPTLTVLDILKSIVAVYMYITSRCFYKSFIFTLGSVGVYYTCISIWYIYSTHSCLAGPLQVECSLIPDVHTVSKAQQALLIGIEHCRGRIP